MQRSEQTVKLAAEKTRTEKKNDRRDALTRKNYYPNTSINGYRDENKRNQRIVNPKREPFILKRKCRFKIWKVFRPKRCIDTLIYVYKYSEYDINTYTRYDYRTHST